MSPSKRKSKWFPCHILSHLYIFVTSSNYARLVLGMPGPELAVTCRRPVGPFCSCSNSTFTSRGTVDRGICSCGVLAAVRIGQHKHTKNTTPPAEVLGSSPGYLHGGLETLETNESYEKQCHQYLNQIGRRREQHIPTTSKSNERLEPRTSPLTFKQDCEI